MSSIKCNLNKVSPDSFLPWESGLLSTSIHQNKTYLYILAILYNTISHPSSSDSCVCGYACFVDFVGKHARCSVPVFHLLNTFHVIVLALMQWGKNSMIQSPMKMQTSGWQQEIKTRYCSNIFYLILSTSKIALKC